VQFPKTKTPRDPRYLAWLRERPCAFCQAPEPSEVSHHGRNGMGMKASDHLALPACKPCHTRHHSKHASPHPRYDKLTQDEKREAYELLALKHRERYLLAKTGES